MANNGYLFSHTLQEYYTDVDGGEPTGVEKFNLPTDPDYIAPILNLEACPLPSDPEPDTTPDPQFVASTARCVQARVRTSDATEARKRDENPDSATYAQWLLPGGSGYTATESAGGWFPYGNDAVACAMGCFFEAVPGTGENDEFGNPTFTMTVNLWLDEAKTQPASAPETITFDFGSGLVVGLLAGQSTYSTGTGATLYGSPLSVAPTYYTEIP